MANKFQFWMGSFQLGRPGGRRICWWGGRRRLGKGWRINLSLILIVVWSGHVAAPGGTGQEGNPNNNAYPWEPGFWTGEGAFFSSSSAAWTAAALGVVVVAGFWLLCWELWGVLLLWLLLPVLLWLEDATIPSCWNVNWGFKNSFFSDTSHQKSITHRLATKSIFIPLSNYNHS